MIGCLNDVPRAFTSRISTGPNMDVGLCEGLAMELEYTLFGVEFATECWGGPSIIDPELNTFVNIASCNSACGGDPSESCGGANVLNLYSLVVPASTTSSSSSASS